MIDDELADAEDELADAVSSPARRMPPALVVFGLTLFASVALPLTPSGTSFLGLLVAAFGRNPLEGITLALGFGAPFWFGLVVAIAAWPNSRLGSDSLRQILVGNASVLHGQLVLVAWLLWRDGIGMLPAALLGFAVVSGGFFIVHHASAAAAEGGVDDQGRRHPGMSPLWLIRWTATVVVSVCGWLRLQVLAGITFGWAVELALASCVAIAVLLARRPQP